MPVVATRTVVDAGLVHAAISHRRARVQRAVVALEIDCEMTGTRHVRIRDVHVRRPVFVPYHLHLLVDARHAALVLAFESCQRERRIGSQPMLRRRVVASQPIRIEPGAEGRDVGPG